MKELIKFLAVNIVSEPKKISIDLESKDKKTFFFLNVGLSDIGKIIGKRGRTVKSIRVLLAALGKVQNKKIFLEIIEPKKISNINNT
jgi:hypothetical protein